MKECGEKLNLIKPIYDLFTGLFLCEGMCRVLLHKSLPMCKFVCCFITVKKNHYNKYVVSTN